MCGLDLPSIQNYASTLRLMVRSALKHSKSSDIRHLWSETSTKNVEIDATLNSTKSLVCAKKVLNLKYGEDALVHIGTMQLQGVAFPQL